MATAKDVDCSVLDFTSDLYDKVVKRQKNELNNTFLSPMSIYTACALTMSGADGNTLVEMFNALHIPQNLRKDFGTIGAGLMKQLAGTKDVEVSIANQLFCLEKVNLLPEFMQTVSKHFKASAEDIGSLPSLEAKRQHINKWVSQNTKSKIPELIAPGALDSEVVLALINALYFRGAWELPFCKEATREGKFRCLDGLQLKVPMMYSKGRYPYAELSDIGAQAIKLPFKGDKWKLLIVLPDEKYGLSKLLTHLQTPGNLKALLASDFQVDEVEVFLPRFKLSRCPPLDVKQLLTECGMQDLFTKKANLSKLCANQRLFISDVMHQAVLEVDEAGATAAAATGMMATPMCFMPNPMIHIDHPFFLALLSESDIPAFIGHFVRPETD